MYRHNDMSIALQAYSAILMLGIAATHRSHESLLKFYDP